MTLIAAWIKKYKKTEELYIVGDSRLRGGSCWDIGTKILDLGRGDVVIAFAGQTANAYPLMLQLQSAVQMHPKVKSRAYDITDLKGHVLRIFNSMWQSISDLPVGQSKPDPAEVRFLLAGFSWRLQRFKIWMLNFNSKENAFDLQGASFHKKKGGGNKYFSFIGDGAGLATNRVYEILRDRKKIRRVGLEMEPFEVLLEFIRDPEKHLIGGPPQVWKIYRHSNSLPFNVYWPNREVGTIAFGGRILLPYERNNFLAIDPDTFTIDQPEWPSPYSNRENESLDRSKI